MIPTLTTPQQVTTYLADHSPVPANPITLNISLWFWAIGFILILAAALDTQQQYLYQLSTIGYSIWILAFFLILIQTIEISVHATLSGIILLTHPQTKDTLSENIPPHANVHIVIIFLAYILAYILSEAFTNVGYYLSQLTPEVLEPLTILDNIILPITEYALIIMVLTCMAYLFTLLYSSIRTLMDKRNEPQTL